MSDIQNQVLASDEVQNLNKNIREYDKMISNNEDEKNKLQNQYEYYKTGVDQQNALQNNIAKVDNEIEKIQKNEENVEADGEKRKSTYIVIIAILILFIIIFMIYAIYLAIK